MALFQDPVTGDPVPDEAASAMVTDPSQPDVAEPDDTGAATRRSRRAIIAGALGGVAALAAQAIGRPLPARAAPGDPMILGAANDSGTSQTTLTNSGTGAAFTLKSTNVSTGATGIFGWSSSTSGNATRGVYGRADGANSNAVVGRQLGSAGSGAAVVAEGNANNGLDASTTSNGKYAIKATGANGTAIHATAIQEGVYAEGYRAVHGKTTASGVSAGVYGENTGGSDTYGVYGRATGTTNARAVFGDSSATSGTNYGIYGQSASTAGRGVYGTASATSGTTYGVYGRSASPQGRGVFGEATSTATSNPIGVLGTSAGEGTLVFFIPVPAAGVVGQSTKSDANSITAGVWGSANSASSSGLRGINFASTGNAYGVWASTLSASGFAGFFSGNVDVDGTLSKNAGSFKIDHPLDPANKWLYHSFVESPDMLNIYNGNVTTDAQGRATVTLPAWFSALNKDIRYQLTAVGRKAQVWVSSEVKNNEFTIESDAPNTQVSWQVTGVRQDAYANAHRIPVEVAKTGAEKGKYRSPVEHGKPASMGMHYEETGRAALDRHKGSLGAKLKEAAG